MPINHVFISLSKIIPDLLTVGTKTSSHISNKKGAAVTHNALLYNVEHSVEHRALLCTLPAPHCHYITYFKQKIRANTTMEMVILLNLPDSTLMQT